MAHEHDWLNEECATCDADWTEWQAEIKDGERTNLIFIFDCVDCGQFYGEQTLTDDGRLLCPTCYSEQRLESEFVEAVPSRTEVAPFTPDLTTE
jgi:formylmethanofuran dehydrogenase subunit E